MAEERKRPTREEVLEKKINLAQQRDTRVIQINSPGGNTITNILRQFDKAYSTFKVRLGEPGEKGIPYKVGAPLMREATNIIIRFSELTEEISDKINFRYYMPDELKDLVQAHKEMIEAQEQEHDL
jgi:hypothetical protein